MKRFTLIIALSAITLLAYPQYRSDLPQKVLKMKSKTGQGLKQTNMLFKTIHFAPGNPLRSPDFLTSLPTQKLDSTVSWSYDEISKTFVNDFRDVYQYDSQMKSTVWLGEEWNDSSKAWKTIEKTEFHYGPDGKVSFFLSFGIDELSGLLIIENKSELYFGPADELDSMLIFSPEAGDKWSLEGKSIFLYDASLRLTQWDLWALYDDDDDDIDDEVFTKGLTTKYEYNNSGQLITEDNYFFLEGEDLLSSESVHSYNTTGQRTSTVVSRINFFTMVLEKTRQTLYTYTATGDVDVEIDSKWEGDAITGKWIDSNRYVYQYGTMNLSEVAFPFYLAPFVGIDNPSSVASKVVAKDETYKRENDEWVQTDKSTYYYSAGTSTGIEEPESFTTGFYPNPALDEITLNWRDNLKTMKLQVYQMSGAMVFEQKVSSGERVSVENLTTGIYLIKLLDGHKTVYTGKLVKN